MRDTTQTHIRNQGIAIAEVRGALQVLAANTLNNKQHIQERIAVAERKLTEVQNKLTEIEFSESVQWLEDKAGVDA
jgi:DNA-binding transcriptional MerR regulator|tara:strand:+ start:1614 stop:1841 length:228 start_codon:yes stop_codon:yes gene_type:complete